MSYMKSKQASLALGLGIVAALRWPAVRTRTTSRR